MPWYCATFDGSLTHAYGVRTGASSFCFWQVDPEGVSLWADVRSGGVGVRLDDRTLDVCDVVCRAGREDESAFAALHAFCRQMCPPPLRARPAPQLRACLSMAATIGTGRTERTAPTPYARTPRTSSSCLRPATNRPFVVIDDGWQPGRGADKSGIGTWDHGNEKFGDMSALAGDVRRAGARPGIWIRPLQAPADAPDSWRLARDRAMLDPTVPEVRQKVVDDLARITRVGIRAHQARLHDVRHLRPLGISDGRGDDARRLDVRLRPDAHDGRSDQRSVFGDSQSAAGDALVIGCNTVSHLSAGVFEICRIGDDTSGTEWARTRKMGVNTLAFRGAQHGAFYVADADCVGVTNAVPWAMNRQWLDLLSRSGTMLFVSLAPDALGAEQRRDLTAALASRRHAAAARRAVGLAAERVSVALAAGGARGRVRLGRG